MVLETFLRDFGPYSDAQAQNLTRKYTQTIATPHQTELLTQDGEVMRIVHVWQTHVNFSFSFLFSSKGSGTLCGLLLL